MIGIALGLPAIRQVAEEKYYPELPGGVLESAGRLFKRSVKMYVYPTRDAGTGEIQTLDKLRMPAPWHHLPQPGWLRLAGSNRFARTKKAFFQFAPPTYWPRITADDQSWEAMVPPAVAEIIKTKRLFRPQMASP